MITLEQVRLLESKITNTLEYVKKLTGENTALKGKLDSYQKRIEELEVLIQGFREEQNRIEDTILSALDRLNKFEDAVESAIPKGSAPRPNESAPPNENKLPEKKKDTEASLKSDEASLEPLSPEEDSGQDSEIGELDIF